MQHRPKELNKKDLYFQGNTVLTSLVPDFNRLKRMQQFKLPLSDVKINEKAQPTFERILIQKTSPGSLNANYNATNLKAEFLTKFLSEANQCSRWVGAPINHTANLQPSEYRHHLGKWRKGDELVFFSLYSSFRHRYI